MTFGVPRSKNSIHSTIDMDTIQPAESLRMVIHLEQCVVLVDYWTKFKDYEYQQFASACAMSLFVLLTFALAFAFSH